MLCSTLPDGFAAAPEAKIFTKSAPIPSSVRAFFMTSHAPSDGTICFAIGQDGSPSEIGIRALPQVIISGASMVPFRTISRT